jgi:hypothetical protein
MKSRRSGLTLHRFRYIVDLTLGENAKERVRWRSPRILLIAVGF